MHLNLNILSHLMYKYKERSPEEQMVDTAGSFFSYWSPLFDMMLVHWGFIPGTDSPVSIYTLVTETHCEGVSCQTIQHNRNRITHLKPTTPLAVLQHRPYASFITLTRLWWIEMILGKLFKKTDISLTEKSNFMRISTVRSFKLMGTRLKCR